MDNTNIFLVKTFLTSLVGEICWSVVAGNGTGSMVLIDFGNKIKRERPLKNPTLTIVEQEFYGQFGIYIQEASWALKSKGEVICTNYVNNENEGLMVSSLKNLIGKKVTSVNLSTENYNFDIGFSDEMYLEVVCIYKSNEFFDNYSFNSPEKIVSVNADKQVLIEPIQLRHG